MPSKACALALLGVLNTRPGYLFEAAMYGLLAFMTSQTVKARKQEPVIQAEPADRSIGQQLEE